MVTRGRGVQDKRSNVETWVGKLAEPLSTRKRAYLLTRQTQTELPLLNQAAISRMGNGGFKETPVVDAPARRIGEVLPDSWSVRVRPFSHARGELAAARSLHSNAFSLMSSVATGLSRQHEAEPVLPVEVVGRPRLSLRARAWWRRCRSRRC